MNYDEDVGDKRLEIFKTPYAYDDNRIQNSEWQGLKYLLLRLPDDGYGNDFYTGLFLNYLLKISKDDCVNNWSLK